MANKTPGTRPSKISSSNKKSGTKQPTPINKRESAFSENKVGRLARPEVPGRPEIEEEIRRKAYELFEERGRHEGFEREDWARAEAEIRNKYQREKSA